jgi:cobalt-zinc-cadmium efflux system protein
LQRFANPQPVSGGLVIGVAAIGIVINTATALLFVTGRKRDLNLRGAFLHMAADAAVSAGVVLAGIAILYTGWTWLDPLVSLLIAAVILAGTWGLLRDSVNRALAAVPAGIDPAAVSACLAALPGVTGVHDLHIWALSTTESALTAHLVKPLPSPDEDALIATASRELRERFGIRHTTLQWERLPLDCPSGTDCGESR